MSQKIYRWVDADGQVHFSDRPPEEPAEHFEALDSGPTIGAPTTSVPEPSRGTTPPRPNDRATGTPVPGEKATEALPVRLQDEIDEECRRARANLSTFDNYARVRFLGDDGEYRFPTPEEIAEERRDAEAFIDANCR